MPMSQSQKQLIAEGAEFLVLGQLLVRGIPAAKAYTGFKGYDILAFVDDEKPPVKIQVKERAYGEPYFPGAKFDLCDVVVLVQLNLSKKDPSEGGSPSFFVLRQDEAVAACEGVTKFGGTPRLRLTDAHDDAKDAWHKIYSKIDR